MVSDADLTKALLVQEGLSLLHATEFLEGNRDSAWDAGRETGGGRLVPRRETEGSGERSDIRLADLRFDERTTDIPLAGSREAWSVVVEIVQVRSVDDPAQ